MGLCLGAAFWASLGFGLKHVPSVVNLLLQSRRFGLKHLSYVESAAGVTPL